MDQRANTPRVERVDDSARGTAEQAEPGRVAVDRELDLKGEICPYTFVKSKLVLETMASGEVLRIVGDHGPATDSMPLSLEIEGHEVLSVGPAADDAWEIIVRCRK